MVPVPSSSYVGSAISIAGNLLIALALNTQKLAHEKLNSQQGSTSASTSAAKPDERSSLLRNRPRSPSRAKRHKAAPPAGDGQIHVYTLSPDASVVTGEVPNATSVLRKLAKDGTPVEQRDGRSGRVRKKWLSIRSESRDRNNGNGLAKQAPIERSGRDARQRSDSKASSAKGRGQKRGPKRSKKETNVYKSKLWWLGLLLMALGELGNFTSYAFAPASIVAPLGTVALIANCFIAPCLLKEKFRKKDLIGIGLSILGAIAVVLSGRSQNQSQFLAAIKTPFFIIYSSISLGLIALLIVLDRTRAGERYLAIDILITALCGGFTVLSTKAFSGFITKDFIDAFKQPVTYPVLAVLAATAILQIIYINKALQRFESRVVVPTQFVSFTISAITGSAILYRDFENLDATRVALFFTGSAAVFAGVILLTRQQDGSSNSSGYSDIKAGSEEEAANESSISASSVTELDIDGVTLSSRPPTDVSRADGGGKYIRRLRSFGTFPMPRSSTTPGGIALITNTPMRTGRPPSITATRMFSPGYILIAGGGGFSSLDVGDESDSGEVTRNASEEDLEGAESRDEEVLEGIQESSEDAGTTSMSSSQTMRRSETV